MAQHWGRKETAIWPPHGAIYTWAALGVALLFALLLLAVHIRFALDPLQRYYLPAYGCSAIQLSAKSTGKYSLLMISGKAKQARMALPMDITAGTTPQNHALPLHLAVSDQAIAHGYQFLTRGPRFPYLNQTLHAYLQANIFEGQSVGDLFAVPGEMGLGSLLLLLPWGIARDVKRRKEWKYGRLLKGPILQSPKEFTKTLCGDGIGFQTNEAREPMRIPASAENQHFEIISDTGTGKTSLMMQMMDQVRGRGHGAIIYDPAGQFAPVFYREGKDIILNPLDARCPYWSPSAELRRLVEAKAIAESLYQPTNDKKGEFFTETPQKIFAHLLTFQPSPQDLVQWMTNPDEIDARVKNTELAALIPKDAPQQRAGVLGSLNLIADSLRMLPTKDEANGTWSATEWAEKRDGWIFITSQAPLRPALRPLHSLWIDLLVLRLLTEPQEQHKPVWFFLDELASLQRLPQLHTAVTENRKSMNPLVLGFQGKAQLEVIYGHMAEVMLSQPATKIFLRTSEAKAAEWVSKTIGQVEVERIQESHHIGQHKAKNYGLVRQVEDAVLPSEIQGLPDLHAFLKYRNQVARFSFPYLEYPKPAKAFIERQHEEVLFRKLVPEQHETPTASEPETPATTATVPSQPAQQMPLLGSM